LSKERRMKLNIPQELEMKEVILFEQNGFKKHIFEERFHKILKKIET
jgi:hypothetical protein